MQRDPLLYCVDITAVSPIARGGEQCARLLALNRKHDSDNDRGQHRQNKQIHSSQLIVGSARIAVAGYRSVGVGGFIDERIHRLRVSGVETVNDFSKLTPTGSREIDPPSG